MIKILLEYSHPARLKFFNRAPKKVFCVGRKFAARSVSR